MKSLKILIVLLAFASLSFLSGCGGYRIVVDIVPATNELQETIVMEDEDLAWSPEKVALIDVSGVIGDEATSLNPLESREGPVGRFSEALRKARDDTKVRAIVIQMNSPGGTVTASDLMYRELKHFKQESGKPVVVLMSALAASGGYYVSVAGDELIANPTTVTGSIGVIMQTFNLSEGMRRIGVHADAITSGPNKAVGSPFEPMSAEHRALLQGLVDDMYETFRGIVLENRPQLTGPNLEMITDGRVVTGRQAVELGVVDRLGDIRDAFESAKTRAGVTSARLVKYHRPTEHVGSVYSGFGAPPAQTQVNLMQVNLGSGAVMDRAQFCYLWDPAAW